MRLALALLLLSGCSHGRACATELDAEWCLVIAGGLIDGAAAGAATPLVERAITPAVADGGSHG